MGLPLTKGPVRLSPSKTHKPSPARRTAQWRREINGSGMRTVFDESRPIDSSSPATSKAESFRGPATATSFGFILSSIFEGDEREDAFAPTNSTSPPKSHCRARGLTEKFESYLFG